MKLSEEDVKLFYRLHWSLLFYTNRQYPAIKGLKAPNFKDQELEKVLELEKKLYSHPELIDSFIAENPFKFNQEELNIVKSWKNFVKDEFFVVTHLKDYTVFLKPDEDPKVYGVLGLYDEIEDITPYLPAYVETVLLPFKGKIVYSGILQSFNIYFGGGMRKTFNAEYQKAKSKYGIILSLEAPIYERKESDEELLRFYIKSEANRAEYQDEIEQILKNNPSLWKIYYQETGRSNSRKALKRFAEIGLESSWFAIYEDTVIASGESEQAVRKQIEDILPGEKRDHVHIFKYAKK